MDHPHGSPYDRGSADAYYLRTRDPHYWPQGTYHGTRVEAKDMTPEQLADYNRGYDEQWNNRIFKDYG